MASILDRYGIKEVADVTFYEIDESGKPGAPVLFLDTLKVSNVEQTAESTSARGGKGNAELVMWDYGKEVSVSIEDALFSPKSMAVMYGVDPNEASEFKNGSSAIMKTVRKEDVVSIAESGSTGIFKINGKNVNVSNVKFYDEKNTVAEISATKIPESAVYATATITATSAQEIIISADSFPGTYYITGDTYARSETTGKDECFQFIIPKAKMQSEVTLTMEAEGDPSTFSMNLKVLRPANGEMMKLVKYDLPQ